MAAKTSPGGGPLLATKSGLGGGGAFLATKSGPGDHF